MITSATSGPRERGALPSSARAAMETLNAEAAGAGQPALYLLRPCIVAGPHTVGAKDLLPGPLAPLGRRLPAPNGTYLRVQVTCDSSFYYRPFTGGVRVPGS